VFIASSPIEDNLEKLLEMERAYKMGVISSEDIDTARAVYRSIVEMYKWR